MKQTLLWKRDESTAQTIEVLRLETTDQHIKAESTICGTVEGTAIAIRYDLLLDINWAVRQIQLSSLLDPRNSLHLYADGSGHWTGSSGSALPELADCYDIDISLTPFTNSLPIKRLGDSLRSRTHLTVVYIDVVRWQFTKVSQFYTRRKPTVYLYEGVFRDFSADLIFDDNGFIVDYPGLFQRLT